MRLLVESSKTKKPHLWLQTTVTYATSNRVGEFLLTPSTPKIEDAADLVESVKTSSSDEIIWEAFCNLIDRILFAVLAICYFFMIVSLLPEGYFAMKYDPIEAET